MKSEEVLLEWARRAADFAQRAEAAAKAGDAEEAANWSRAVMEAAMRVSAAYAEIVREETERQTHLQIEALRGRPRDPDFYNRILQGCTNQGERDR